MELDINFDTSHNKFISPKNLVKKTSEKHLGGWGVIASEFYKIINFRTFQLTFNFTAGIQVILHFFIIIYLLEFKGASRTF